MRRLTLKLTLASLMLGVAAACGSPTATPVPPTSAPTLPAVATENALPASASATATVAATAAATVAATAAPTDPAPLPTVTSPPAGYPVSAPLPTSPPGGYPPGGYPAPTPIILPSPTAIPTLSIAPTVPVAPNAIAPENAAQLRPVGRITPTSREIYADGIFPPGPIWYVALSKDQARLAVAKPDGVHVYDLAGLRPLNYIDTGSALPLRVFFLDDGRTLMTSSAADAVPLGATFFDVATGQRRGLLRVPWGVFPNLGTWAYPSPSEQTLVIHQGNSARFYDLRTLQPLITWPDRWFPATAVVFSPDSRLAAISFSGVAVWEVETGRLLFRPTPANTSTTMQPLAAFSPDGQLLATADGRTLRLWEVSPPRQRFEAALGEFHATRLVFSPDGQKLAVATESQVSVWSAQTGERLLATGGYAPQFSPDSAGLVVQSGEDRVGVWGLPGRQARFTLTGTEPQFMPDGRLLIRVMTDTYAFADANSGNLGPTFAAQRLRVLSDGRLVDVRDDGSIRVLDGTSGQPLASLAIRARPAPATSVAFRADGRILIASGNATVRLDALVDPDPYNLPPTAEQGGWIYQIALAPDGKTVGSASKDGRLALFDSDDLYALYLETNERVSEPGAGELTSVAFSPDGARVAAGSSEGSVKVWSTASSLRSAPLQTFTGHTNWVWGVAYSPDGRQLASASADRTVRIWDAASGRTLFTLRGHMDTVRSVAYSPDGALLVSAGWDGALKVWDTRTGELRRTLTGHAGGVNQAVFSRDGRLIASASRDGTVRLWETATGRELAVLRPEGGNVWAVAFSPDGRQLAAALNDGAVQVWEAP
ncbi:MAG: hypothetical protein RMK99_00310 [Anaerolineales bacterium]|nr:hypothetical protein [Anaerolineales bacterium]